MHESFGPLAPSRMFRGGEGPAVRFVQATLDDSVGTADDEVDRLLDEGWGSSNIAPLTTGPPSLDPGRTHRLFHDQVGYWVPGSTTRLRTRARVKRPRAQGVRPVPQRGRVARPCARTVYVGMSRTTDELVVVGTPRPYDGSRARTYPGGSASTNDVLVRRRDSPLKPNIAGRLSCEAGRML